MWTDHTRTVLAAFVLVGEARLVGDAVEQRTLAAFT